MTALLSTHPHLRDLTDYANALTRHAPLTSSLKNIVAPGAAYAAPTSKHYSWWTKGISIRDYFWYKHSLSACNDMRLNWDPHYTLEQPNLFFNQTDFLALTTHMPCDVLIICFVPREELAKRMLQSPAAQKSNNEIGCYMLSPEGEDRWLDAAERSGARIIITFSNGNEIDGSYFTSARYSLFSTERVMAPMVNLTSYMRYRRDVVVRHDLLSEVHRRLKSPALSLG